MASLRLDVLWFGPVNGFQVKGATVGAAKPYFLTCTGDGSDGQPTCADRAEAWKASSGRRLPGLFERVKIPEGEVGRLYLGAFSAGGQCLKRVALHAADRALITAMLLSDATYTIEWQDQKKGLTKPIEGFLHYAMDCIADGRLFLATASGAPNKSYASGAQSLDGLRRGVEATLGEDMDDATADPIWSGLRAPVRAWRKRNVILADFGDAYKHGEHATVLAPILWPRAIALSAPASPTSPSGPVTPVPPAPPAVPC